METEIKEGESNFVGEAIEAYVELYYAKEKVKMLSEALDTKKSVLNIVEQEEFNAWERDAASYAEERREFNGYRFDEP